MMGRLFGVWQQLLHGLWFRPSVVAAGLALLGLLVPYIDEQHWTANWTFLYRSGPETARALLATLAGSLITVLALVFSLTLVAMQLVSSQLTPRALRGFLSSATTQVTAGAFVGTVLYCFLIMRHVGARDPNAGAYVPQLSVTLGLVLGVFALGLLIVFVNHIASWMQLSSISRRIALDTLVVIRHRFPRRYADEAPPAAEPPSGEQSFEVTAQRVGFVQYYALNHGRLAPPREVKFLELLVDTGAFVCEGQPLARVWTDEEPSQELLQKLRGLVVIGEERDVDQDAAFGLRQLVDIALRALSPGVNDPTTAVTCLHYLQMLVAELGRRKLGSRAQGDDPSRLRLPSSSFESYVDLAFEEIALFGASQPRVVRELGSALQRVESSVYEIGAARRAAYVRTLRQRVLEAGTGTAPGAAPRSLRAVTRRHA